MKDDRETWKEPDVSEFGKFDAVMRKVLSVSHDELKKREAKWKKQREKKKRAKSRPAFPGHRACTLSQLGHVSRSGVLPVS